LKRKSDRAGPARSRRGGALEPASADGNPGILGQLVVLNGAPAQVVGVLPPSFAFLDARAVAFYSSGIDVWLPAPMTRAGGFGTFGWAGVARLRDGVELEDARRELTGLLPDLTQAFPGEPAGVMRMIVWQGGLVAGAGVAVGLAIALFGADLIASLLYGVSPRDPAIFASTALLLLIVALVACWLPARRAARLSPLDALRAE
jgi:hypothetical protein